MKHLWNFLHNCWKILIDCCETSKAFHNYPRSFWIVQDVYYLQNSFNQNVNCFNYTYFRRSLFGRVVWLFLRFSRRFHARSMVNAVSRARRSKLRRMLLQNELVKCSMKMIMKRQQVRRNSQLIYLTFL